MENNTVVINKKIINEMKVLEVTGDIIVPDIKPDIVSIINANGIGYIYKEDVNSGRIRVDGNLDTYIVYLAENGETRSIQNTLTFSENIENTAIEEGLYFKHSVFLEKLEARVLNERKISITGKVKICIEMFQKEEIEVNIDGKNTGNIEVLKENCKVKSLIGTNKIKTSIKEDIKVDNSFEIAEILRTNIEIKNMENKISYNKILAKADAEIVVIFLTEDNKIGSQKVIIPVMSFIDINNITENDNCDVCYSIRNMLFKVNSKEMHSISCQIDFDVSCEAYQIKEIDVIEDMYGTRNEVNFTKREIEAQIAGEEIGEKININQRVLLEDVLNILDTRIDVNIVNNNESELIIDFYYEADNRTGLNLKTIKLPFMIKSEWCEENLNFKISKKEFTISNENVDCDIEILVSKKDSLLKKISIIDNIEIKQIEDENEYKMYMYFVKQGDTLWKIAKRFKVCMNDIAKLNDLENIDKLSIGEKLYIMR